MLPSKPTNPAGQVPYHTGVGIGTGNTNGSGVQMINFWFKNNDHYLFLLQARHSRPFKHASICPWVDSNP